MQSRRRSLVLLTALALVALLGTVARLHTSGSDNAQPALVDRRARPAPEAEQKVLAML